MMPKKICTPTKATNLTYDLLMQLEEMSNASLEISTACSEESNDQSRNLIEENQIDIETENSQSNNYTDVPFFDFKIKKSESLSQLMGISTYKLFQYLFFLSLGYSNAKKQKRPEEEFLSENISNNAIINYPLTRFHTEDKPKELKVVNSSYISRNNCISAETVNYIYIVLVLSFQR